MKEFIQLKFPVRFGDGQFFAKKPGPEPEEPEDDEEEEEEPKPKGKESRPAWVNEILEALKPQAETNQSKQQIPVPEVPATEEPEEEPEEQHQEQPQKKSLLSWLW